jgi:ABC-2 type transport system permease protein
MSPRRVRAMARKEVIQIRRDIRTLIAALVMPVVLLFLFGYALSLDVNDIPFIVQDRDRTTHSRDLVERLTASRYFSLVRYVDRSEEIDAALDRGKALMALVIPEGFAAGLTSGAGSSLQVLFDGTNSNTASIAAGYFSGIAMTFNVELVAGRLRRLGLQLAPWPLDVRLRIWFNEEMKSRNFIIPGLTAVIMMAICVLLTALTISREKETGTLEQLVSTPITRTELILGKLLPYMGLGVIQMALVIGTGIFLFGVPFRGSYLNLVLAGLIFLMGTLGWGLFISAVARNQLEASQIVVITAFLPSFLLSGFIYPIENMPIWLQAVTYVVPARYFVEILKGLFLTGAGLDVLWPQMLFLTAYSLIVLSLARRKFQKRLL